MKEKEGSTNGVSPMQELKVPKIYFLVPLVMLLMVIPVVISYNRVMTDLRSLHTPRIDHSHLEPTEHVRADLRMMATALETYFVDSCTYATMVPLSDYANDMKALRRAGGADLLSYKAGGFRCDGNNSNCSAFGLTSPIAYLSHVLEDPFSPDASLPYVYYTPQAPQGSVAPYIIVSPGPDGHYDIDPAEDIDWNQILDDIRAQLMAGPLSYDPTNGAISPGDIWRLKE